jgi:hypothetical protein
MTYVVIFVGCIAALVIVFELLACIFTAPGPQRVNRRYYFPAGVATVVAIAGLTIGFAFLASVCVQIAQGLDDALWPAPIDHPQTKDTTP